MERGFLRRGNKSLGLRLSVPHCFASTATSQFLSSSSDLFTAVYVINLDRRPDRWAFITEQLQRAGFKKTEYERFSAVDGSSISIERAHACGLISTLGQLRLRESESHRIWGMDLNPGAVGCALSHMLLWAQIAARRQSCALVVEDDSLFPEAFHAKYRDRMGHVPPDWELVYVSGLDTAGQAPQLRVGRGVSRVPQLHRTTNCYAISHSGARRMLQLCAPLTYQIDTAMTANVVRDAATGLLYVDQPVCYTMQPSLVVQATRMGSDIQSDSGRDMREEERARYRSAGWSDDPGADGTQT